MKTALDRIQEWVATYPENNTQSQPRLQLSNLGNPGWSIILNLLETDLVNINFDWVSFEKSEDYWSLVRIKDSRLELNCSAPELVHSFNIISGVLDTRQAPEPVSWKNNASKNQPLQRLQHWYLNNCDGNWERDYGVDISSLPDPGWELNLDLLATQWEDLQLEPTSTHTSENDWLHLRTTQRGLQVTCGPLGLATAIDQAFSVLTPENMTYPE